MRIPTAPLLVALLVAPLVTGVTGPGSALAQDDGGMDVAGDADGGTDGQSNDDAGAGDEDGGLGDPGPRTACSCEIIEDRGEEGTVHTCTGSFDEGLCDTFTCERSNVLQRACPTSAIDLCCDMGARGLYTNLYTDCTYPNCEGGFRAQCADYGGIVFEGACGGQDESDAGTSRATDDGNSRGFCTVGSGPGAAARGGSAALLAIGALLLARMRRRRIV